MVVMHPTLEWKIHYSLLKFRKYPEILTAYFTTTFLPPTR